MSSDFSLTAFNHFLCYVCHAFSLCLNSLVLFLHIALCASFFLDIAFLTCPLMSPKHTIAYLTHFYTNHTKVVLLPNLCHFSLITPTPPTPSQFSDHHNLHLHHSNHKILEHFLFITTLANNTHQPFSFSGVHKPLHLHASYLDSTSQPVAINNDTSHNGSYSCVLQDDGLHLPL